MSRASQGLEKDQLRSENLAKLTIQLSEDKVYNNSIVISTWHFQLYTKLIFDLSGFAEISFLEKNNTFCNIHKLRKLGEICLVLCICVLILHFFLLYHILR